MPMHHFYLEFKILLDYPTKAQFNKMDVKNQNTQIANALCEFWIFKLFLSFFINMGKQEGHHDDHHNEHQHSGQSQHGGHHSANPFTHEERVLIEIARHNEQFEGHHHHHHHHHHEHMEYRRPFNLDTNLGLFALKKLNAINPEILREKDKILLNPAGPGVLTHMFHGLIYVTFPLFSFYVWRKFGAQGFLKPKIALSFGALLGASIGFQHAFSYLRELTFQNSRRRMIQFYKGKYGQKFLLDVLEPSFKLPELFESK